jgi:antitoxin component YwqK of YwqJK toxin-antitoxin module
MKKLSKTNILLLVFLCFANLIFSQDYYKLSEQFFNDTKPSHVEFLKQAIRENNAEQLLIDFQKVDIENERDIQRVDEQLKEIEDNFKSNYTNPEYVYECKKTKEYKDEVKHLNTRLTYIESSLNIAKSSYNLCKNNVYRTGNCSQQQNNYNKQVNLYNSVLSELNSAVDNYDYYKDDCNDVVYKYQNAFEYAKRRTDNLIAARNQRTESRIRQFEYYRNQVNEVILSTPMHNIEYYDNGNKSKEGYLDLRTNKYVGTFKKYYSNGQLELECTFENDQLDGHYSEYYISGTKKTDSNYIDGILNGNFIEYFETGDTKIKVYYKDGKYDGNYVEYYETGTKKVDSNYKEGELNGNATLYYETGIKKSEADFERGNLVNITEYNEQGVDEQAEMRNEILDHWRQEREERDKYYETIDNTSVAESIAANPIRTIKEDPIELVVDFSKASKETVNFFLVRPDNEKSIKLREKYINDIHDTDGGKLSCNYFGDDGQIILKAVYDGLTVTINDYNEDGSYSQADFQNRNKIGMLKEFDKNGNRLEGEEREADINTFLKQKNFYTPATLSYGKNIEISDGIWEVVHGGGDQDTYRYSYKQLNDTQIELTFIQSNDSSNEYKKGDKFIVELLFMNIKSKFYKLTITPLDTSYGGLLEGYYYK